MSQTRLSITKRTRCSTPPDSCIRSSRLIILQSTRSNHELAKKLYGMQQRSSLSPTRYSCRGWIAKLTCLLKWFKQGGSHSGPRKMSTLASTISFVRYQLADWLTNRMVILCPDCVILQRASWKSKEDGKQTFFSRICLFAANDDSLFGSSNPEVIINLRKYIQFHKDFCITLSSKAHRLVVEKPEV